VVLVDKAVALDGQTMKAAITAILAALVARVETQGVAETPEGLLSTM
jgi:hypothetical protein